jgi:Fe2+ or Zn2+ uptake regulation protein
LADPPKCVDDDLPEKQVADLIMEYLSQHPHAMDTAEGVAEWWIHSDRLRADLATTRRALDRLEKSGYLAKIGDGDRAHYRLRQQPRPQ